MKLTNKQEKALQIIKKGLEKRCTDKLYIGMTYHDSWKKNKQHDFPKGISLSVLEQLNKKGVINLISDGRRKIGVFNPVADSWGYSTYFVEYYIELNNRG